MSGATRRSTGMLLVAVILAIGAGALATVLKPQAPPTPSVTATGSLSVPVPVKSAPPDPAVARERLLEQLIVDARSEPKPERLPAYEALVLPCRRRMPACAPVLERLGDPDVPLTLLEAFASELPRGDIAGFDALMGPLLGSGSPEKRDLAIGLYRQQGRAKVATDTACGCGFGVVPTPLGSEAWLFADSPRGGLAWEPIPIEGGWRLGVRRDANGPQRLAQRIDVIGSLRIEAAEGGAVVRVAEEE